MDPKIEDVNFAFALKKESIWCPVCRKRICKIIFMKFLCSNHIFDCLNCGTKFVLVWKNSS